MKINLKINLQLRLPQTNNLVTNNLISFQVTIPAFHNHWVKALVCNLKMESKQCLNSEKKKKKKVLWITSFFLGMREYILW